jgi:hypothetical protein
LDHLAKAEMAKVEKQLLSTLPAQLLPVFSNSKMSLKEGKEMAEEGPF